LGGGWRQILVFGGTVSCFSSLKKSRRWSDLNSGVLEIFCGFTAPGTCLYCVLTNQKGYYKLLGYLSIPIFFLLTRFSDNQKASNVFITASIVQSIVLKSSWNQWKIKKILHFNSFPKKLNWCLTQWEKKFSKYLVQYFLPLNWTTVNLGRHQD